MSDILKEADPTMVTATLAGHEHKFKLTLGAIEAYERIYPTGIYQLYNRLGDPDRFPPFNEVRDFLVVSMQGAGYEADEVKRIFEFVTVKHVLDMIVIALAVCNAGLLSDAENDDEGDNDGKKSQTG